MRIMVIGATGLTGHHVVEGLLAREEITTVVAPVRREMGMDHPRLEPRLVDFDELGSAEPSVFRVDALVCCLGTTLKKAGSRARFRKVDYEYALAAARRAREGGARACILMSAIGASSSSPVFYNRVKGELEDAVKTLGYPFLSIYHPSLLLGDRREQRGAEALGAAIMPAVSRALMGPLQKYRAIRAETVAQAMVGELCSLAAGLPSGSMVRVHEYRDILEAANGLDRPHRA